MGREAAKRMPYIDAMKGIAIVLVVVMHSLMNAKRNIDSDYAIAINFGAYMAVPSFFFINGYLFNHKYALSPVMSIIKKFKAYYIPFVGFSLLFWMFHNLFVSIRFSSGAIYSFKDYVINFFLIFLMHMESGLCGPIWFLRALLIMVCSYILIEYVVFRLVPNRNVRFLIMFIIVAGMYFAGKARLLPNVYNSNKILVNMSFFFLGVVVREFKVDEIIDRHKILVCVVGIGAILLTSIIYPGAIGVDVGYRDLPGNLLGILGIFALAKLPFVENNKLLSFLGKASLDIMAMHFFVFKVVEFVLIVLTHQSLERLSEGPVLTGTKLPVNLVYVVISLALCSLFYVLRTKIVEWYKNKRNKV